jgi:hypothetical protein
MPNVIQQRRSTRVAVPQFTEFVPRVLEAAAPLHIWLTIWFCDWMEALLARSHLTARRQASPEMMWHRDNVLLSPTGGIS